MKISDAARKASEDIPLPPDLSVSAVAHRIQQAIDTQTATLRAEVERLRACLESVAYGSPPSDWKWYACLGDYCGYGKRGDVDFVDEPGPGNVDDMFTYGVDIGRWQAAKTAREALAAQREKRET